MKSKILFLLLVLALIPAHGYAQSTCPTCIQIEQPKLAISRTAKIEAEPDEANIRLSLWVEEVRPDYAVKSAKQKMGDVTQALKDLGVAAEDIKTIEYSVNPMFEGKKMFSSVHRPTSYTVSQRVQVKIKNVESVGGILGRISGMDYLKIDDLEFTSSKINALKRQALQKAAEDARQTALDLASAAGATLGKVISINESYAEPVVARGQAQMYKMMESMATDATPVPVSAGKLTIEATVSIVYALE